MTTDYAAVREILHQLVIEVIDSYRETNSYSYDGLDKYVNRILNMEAVNKRGSISSQEPEKISPTDYPSIPVKIEDDRGSHIEHRPPQVMTTDYAALRGTIQLLLEDHEYEVTNIPKHWKRTPERLAIDKKLLDALLTLYQRQVESLVDEVIGGDELLVMAQPGTMDPDYHRDAWEKYRTAQLRDVLRAEQRERFLKLKE